MRRVCVVITARPSYSRIKSALTATSLSIPYRDGSLMLGTWQGIYLGEHRNPDSRHKA